MPVAIDLKLKKRRKGRKGKLLYTEVVMLARTHGARGLAEGRRIPGSVARVAEAEPQPSTRTCPVTFLTFCTFDLT